MFKKILITSSLLTFSLGAGTAYASGYAGVSIGQTDVPGDFENATSYAFTGGYRVNPNFALEGSYINLGESDDDFAPVWTLEASGLNFSAVGIIPVNETVEFFGKLGLFMWDVELREEGYGEIASDDGSDISMGVGINFNVTEQFGLVAEYQRFELDDEDVSNISIGARLNF